MIKKSDDPLEDPLKDVDWSYYWKKDLKSLPSTTKDKKWDNIAEKFRGWMEKDDYPGKLLSKIKTSPEYSILDIGCGEGTISIPLAKKVSKVTCVDLSSGMLKILKERAVREKLDNLKYIKTDLQDISVDDFKKHDIVVASRSLNGIADIKNILREINKIGKHVYITLWGPEGRKYEELACNLLNREPPKYPSYIYVYNLLYQMGITANVEKLECETINTYCDFEEAMDRYKWKIGDLNQEEEQILRKHLEKTLIVQEDGTLENPYEKPDWILIWWKNE